MPLFTSNSKHSARILRILIVFTALFAAYNAFLAIFTPRVNIIQNQWSANIAFAQEYLYAKIPPKNIIVGSSLASRLDGAMLENAGIYNLAFGGGSAITGLMIIATHAKAHANALPHRIFIEENIALIRGSDRAMVERLFMPILRDCVESSLQCARNISP